MLIGPGVFDFKNLYTSDCADPFMSIGANKTPTPGQCRFTNSLKSLISSVGPNCEHGNKRS